MMPHQEGLLRPHQEGLLKPSVGPLEASLRPQQESFLKPSRGLLEAFLRPHREGLLRSGQGRRAALRSSDRGSNEGCIQQTTALVGPAVLPGLQRRAAHVGPGVR